MKAMTLYNPHDFLLSAIYFAPRGKVRLLQLGQHLAQRYLSPLDKLIGVVGDAGAGKSLLIKGMFPGLELTNDDAGVNSRPLPVLADAEFGRFSCHTYHVDVRFELAFTSVYELSAAVQKALAAEKRVIIEHFELIYPHLKTNAEILLGIGEEVMVSRPNIFGPLPEDITKIVFSSLKFRRMAHTAEDLTTLVLKEEFGYKGKLAHDDVRHGFVLEFKEKPDFDLQALEEKVKEYIQQKAAVKYLDEEHISIGDREITCTGPRIHVGNTSEVENFKLLKEFKYDSLSDSYLLVGLVGYDRPARWDKLNDLTS